jgi:GT2 family glycosyltransferase
MNRPLARLDVAVGVGQEDVQRLHALLLGREPEPEALARICFKRDLSEVLNELVRAPEFKQGLQRRLLRGLAPVGGLYDAPPGADLIRWSAKRLPLGEEARVSVAAARSWLDLFGVIFHDPDFRRGVSELDEGLAQASYISDPPIGPATWDDVDYLCDFFLGRAPEPKFVGWEFVGSEMAVAIEACLDSTEFQQKAGELLNGLLPRGAGFTGAPADETLGWAAERLPLSQTTRDNLWTVKSRTEAFEAVFADPCFAAALDDPHILRRLPALANAEDVSNLYRLLLGREAESDLRTSGWMGMELATAAFSFLASDEYNGSVRHEIMSATAGTRPLFDCLLIPELRTWAAKRLPLTASSAARLPAAESWYSVAAIVLGDPKFWASIGRIGLDRLRDLGQPLPFAIQIGVIDASGLFERDWYLQTYKQVAASGQDPLEHFVQHGYREGLDPNRLFDAAWYYCAYPDVRLLGMNPLLHYILEGANEGNLPHPFFPQVAVVAAAEAGYPRTPLALFTSELLPRGVVRFPRFDVYDQVRAIEALEDERDRAGKRRHINLMILRPFFLVLVTPRPKRSDRGTIESLRKQSYQDYIRVGSPAEALSLGGTLPTNTYLLTIDAGDELVEDALYHLASALNAEPNVDLLYFDQDHLHDSGHRTAPFYKPDWSPDYLESMNYVGTCACYAYPKAAPLLADAKSTYDLTLRFTEGPCQARRVGRVLVSCRDDLHDYPSRLQTTDMEALADRFRRTGRKARITPYRAGASAYVATVAVDPRPTISVVIPTAGKIAQIEGRRIDLIVNCLETISAQSDLSNIEFIVIDNGDFDRSRLDGLGGLRLKLLTYERPEVNIAAKINFGAATAAGEILLILNDDIEPLNGDRIDRMLSHFRKPHVGLVGAKLLYPNMLVQHVGLASCDGMPEHVNRYDASDSEGYFYSNVVARNYSAVTGAVGMVRKDVFDLVEGYDERLPIDFNDIDFSHKIAEAGYTVICEPQARLFHFESVSAVRRPGPWDFDYFSRKWAHQAEDPFYDERRLNRHPPTFSVAQAQRRH